MSTERRRILATIPDSLAREVETRGELFFTAPVMGPCVHVARLSKKAVNPALGEGVVRFGADVRERTVRSGPP